MLAAVCWNQLASSAALKVVKSSQTHAQVGQFASQQIGLRGHDVVPRLIGSAPACVQLRQRQVQRRLQILAERRQRRFFIAGDIAHPGFIEHRPFAAGLHQIIALETGVRFVAFIERRIGVEPALLEARIGQRVAPIEGMTGDLLPSKLYCPLFFNQVYGMSGRMPHADSHRAAAFGGGIHDAVEQVEIINTGQDLEFRRVNHIGDIAGDL